jgi:His-Xaa-Ser system radical SAM maturase HxsB
MTNDLRVNWYSRQSRKSRSGDHAFLTDAELENLTTNPASIAMERRADLQSKGFLATAGASGGSRKLTISRRASKRETVSSGPSLHIIVVTLQCAHSCKYCQVSRSLTDVGHTMSLDDLNSACDSIFQSPAETLTVEFQGGDPLLRFDLVRHAVLKIVATNVREQRTLRFVVASTLHQLDEEMCAFFKEHGVFLSTSLDGPEALHNKNRPTPTRDAYARTLKGVGLARDRLGFDSVSALMTATKESLQQPEAIVDEYVRLGFREVFIRPLSAYGFAKRNQAFLAYSLGEFQAFYCRALARVIHWNQQGVELREVYASIILNKLLSTFDAGYVDLQSPTGAGQSVLVYNYDGFVYPSDEARMLAETGDRSLRLGRIGQSLEELAGSSVQRKLVAASLVEEVDGCRDCAYNQFCAPNPVDAQAQFGTPFAPVVQTEHCQRHMHLFDSTLMQLRIADEWTMDLFHRWATPVSGEAT